MNSETKSRITTLLSDLRGLLEGKEPGNEMKEFLDSHTFRAPGSKMLVSELRERFDTVHAGWTTPRFYRELRRYCTVRNSDQNKLHVFNVELTEEPNDAKSQQENTPRRVQEIENANIDAT